MNSSHFCALDSTAPPAPMIGRVVAGKFEVEAALGQGAMGVVYKARHVSLDVPVALKVLHTELARNQSFSERFRREAKIACSVAHANSVRIIDCGAEADGTLYLAMEYVDGRDLYSVLEEQGRLAPGRAAHVMSQVLSALAAAHAAGIVHRDVKPENVLIVMGTDDDGEPTEIAKVCDFGIASMASSDGRAPKGSRLTLQGIVIGTPSYMSPEQARGQTTDARSDIYAAGVVLYQLLTGQVPFDADDAFAIALRHISEEPTPLERLYPGVHAGLADVAMRAIRKDPAERFQSARAMRVAIRRAMGWGEVEAPSTRAPAVAPSLVSTLAPPAFPGELSISTPPPAVSTTPPPASEWGLRRPHGAPSGETGDTRAAERAIEPATGRARGGGRSLVLLLGAGVAAFIALALRHDHPAGAAREGASRTAVEAPHDVATTAFVRHDSADPPVTGSASVPAIPAVQSASVARAVATTPAIDEPAALPRRPTPVTAGTTAPADRAAAPPTTPRTALPRAPEPAGPPEPASIASASVTPSESPSPRPLSPPSIKRPSLGAARVTLGAVEGERGVTPRSVSAGIEGVMPQINECYRSAFGGAAPPGAGRGSVHVGTDGDGVVTMASARLPVTPAAARCIERVVVGVRFAGVDTGEATADVSLSFEDE